VIGNAQTSILTESAARQVFLHFNSGENCLKVAGVRERREEREEERMRRSRRR
jgi:hypothetical protein